MAKLTALGGGDGKQFSGGFSDYAEYINELVKAHSSEIDFEQTLNKIKISNIKNLAEANRKQQKELLEQTKKANLDLLEIEQAKRLEQIQALYEVQIENATKLEKDAAESDKKQKEAAILKEFQFRKKAKEKEAKEDLKRIKKQNAEAAKDEAKYNAEMLTGANNTMQERLTALKKMATVEVTKNGEKTGETKLNVTKLMSSLTTALGNFTRQLDGTIDSIAGRKSAIDTRLQGTKGSTWDDISKNITGIAGVSPLIKQSAIADRVSSMVEQGIAFNVEQRATLDVMKDKIATTFDATNATLLRLVRIQDQDTTAGRLGMESALTSFLNNMYETTEYMKTISDGVKSNLEDAMALMSGTDAVGLEYQVQKWLGSMYSTGMSSTAINSIAGTLGKLGSGQLESVTGGGTSNLVIIAANRAGLNVSDMLNDGLDSNTANKLLASINDYLANLYDEAGDSKVMQQQFAEAFGVTAADLKAAANLSSSAGIVSSNGLTYSTALQQLNNMASSMYARTSIGEMMGNTFSNLQYTMAAGIANNPALYGIYKTANMLSDLTGGIDFSTPLVMGTGTAQTFNVADIMRTGALSASILSGLGQMVGAGGNGGVSGVGLLNAIGVNSGASVVTRGNGLIGVSGTTTSESGYTIGNGSSADIQSKSMTDATDSAKTQTASAVDESEEVKLSDLNSNVVKIYETLREIAAGRSILTTRIEGTVNINNGFSSGL